MRNYRPEDAARTYAVYRSAITQTARADYEPEQIAAWVGPEAADLSEWDARRKAARTFVATVDEQVVGFTDFLKDGLLDMLFIDHNYVGRGIARQLVETVKLEAASAGLPALRTRASRTARPAFERFGFRLIAANPDNTIRGRRVPNFEMEYDLTGTSLAARSSAKPEHRPLDHQQGRTRQ